MKFPVFGTTNGAVTEFQKYDLRTFQNYSWSYLGDYRFIALRGKDTGAAFLGQDDRYGHRVYGGIIINSIR